VRILAYTDDFHARLQIRYLFEPDSAAVIPRKLRLEVCRRFRLDPLSITSPFSRFPVLQFCAALSNSNSNLLKQQRAKSHLQVAKTMIKHATYAYY